MAEDDFTYDYREYWWGDVIEGTKAGIQSLGIGVGFAFPGEPGGPKRTLNTIDPRGFPCAITKGRRDDFSAHIGFPERRFREERERSDFAPGVVKEDQISTDDYVGTAEALVNAGLVQAGQFPGLPGMPKKQITVRADGAPCTASRPAGTKTIEKLSRAKWRVSITVPDDVWQERLRAAQLLRAVHEYRANQIPRPPRLDALLIEKRNQRAIERRKLMRLVWQRPIPKMEFPIPAA